MYEPRFRCLGTGTTRPAGSRRGRIARGRTRPKSFHARQSAETGVYSRFSFINQAPSFYAAPLFIDGSPTHSHGGVVSPFSRLIDIALVYRDRYRGILSTHRKRKDWNHGVVPSRIKEVFPNGQFIFSVRNLKLYFRD